MPTKRRTRRRSRLPVYSPKAIELFKEIKRLDDACTCPDDWNVLDPDGMVYKRCDNCKRKFALDTELHRELKLPLNDFGAVSPPDEMQVRRWRELDKALVQAERG